MFARIFSLLIVSGPAYWMSIARTIGADGFPAGGWAMAPSVVKRNENSASRPVKARKAGRKRMGGRCKNLAPEEPRSKPGGDALCEKGPSKRERLPARQASLLAKACLQEHAGCRICDKPTRRKAAAASSPGARAANCLLFPTYSLLLPPCVS